MLAETRRPSVLGLPRRIDKRIQEIKDDKWVLDKEDKAHYALGIIGVQEDLEKLDLESGDKEDDYKERKAKERASRPREERE